MTSIRLTFICLLSLFLAVSVLADEPEKYHRCRMPERSTVFETICDMKSEKSTAEVSAKNKEPLCEPTFT